MKWSWKQCMKWHEMVLMAVVCGSLAVRCGERVRGEGTMVASRWQMSSRLCMMSGGQRKGSYAANSPEPVAGRNEAPCVSPVFVLPRHV